MPNVNLEELAKRENERVEWKENVADIDNVLKTISAFANDFSNLGGGYVVCGAKEKKDAYGFQEVVYTGLNASRFKQVCEKVLSDSREKISPPIIPLVEEIPLPSDPAKRILVFIVSSTEIAHAYRARGKDSTTYYIRSGSNTIEARNGLLRELLIRKKQLPPWDKRINKNSDIEDIDLIAFRDSLSDMRLWNSNKAIEDYISDREKLADFIPTLAGKTGLETELRMKNFTILMFGKNPLNFFDGAYATFSSYKGKDRSEPTGERHRIKGTIVQQARKLIDLLNAESYTVFDKNSDTPNQVKYPVLALKEAVVNALVHRDYEIDQPVKITVFSDRIEIHSPGRLPHQIDAEQFKVGKATAYWRNQSLNYMFNRLQLAQAEGQGIPTIIKTMKDVGCPAPEFEIGKESVTCILPAHPRHQLLREISEIEDKIVLRNYDDARSRLENLLEEDLYNFKALELYCEVNQLLDSPENVIRLIENKSLDLKRLTPNTLLAIADVISLLPDPRDKKSNQLVLNIINQAVAGRLVEDQIMKAALALRKLGNDERAEEFISNEMDKNPLLKKNPRLLQLRGRARIDLAKLCEQSTKDRRLTSKRKAEAWDKLRHYLEFAEKDLSEAMLLADSFSEQDWLRKDIEYLKKMRLHVQKPLRREFTVHVDNIPPNTTKVELEELFSKYGAINRIIIYNKNNSKTNSVSADIEFSSKESARSALRDKYNIFMGSKKIFLNSYRPRQR